MFPLPAGDMRILSFESITCHACVHLSHFRPPRMLLRPRKLQRCRPRLRVSLVSYRPRQAACVSYMQFICKLKPSSSSKHAVKQFQRYCIICHFVRYSSAVSTDQGIMHLVYHFPSSILNVNHLPLLVLLPSSPAQTSGIVGSGSFDATINLLRR